MATRSDQAITLLAGPAMPIASPATGAATTSQQREAVVTAPSSRSTTVPPP